MRVKFKNSDLFPHDSVKVGRLYLVLAISLITDENNGSGAVLQILDEHSGISDVPAECFDIIDERVSKHWVARLETDGSLLLWPPEFFSEYFHDDFSDGIFSAREKFNSVVKKMQSEFESNSNDIDSDDQ
ncbi:hypothetical protein [Xanthomonas albilineans]|uniref:hypothetical protein n=1 Tax=Xanthomonas albilineans TaxID=29447 RepID=UPI00126A5835|nr:hypothetical protein [Xanthomonas albilineans]